ncbi:MAG: protein kinase [Planctomycetota bacterium]
MRRRDPAARRRAAAPGRGLPRGPDPRARAAADGARARAPPAPRRRGGRARLRAGLSRGLRARPPTWLATRLRSRCPGRPGGPCPAWPRPGARPRGDSRRHVPGSLRARERARAGRHGRGVPRPASRDRRGARAQGHAAPGERRPAATLRARGHPRRAVPPHPGVVAIHTCEALPDGRTYFAMERVEGPDLARVLAEGGPLPPARALPLLARLAQALAHLHAAGLAHRDLKPANVLLRAGDQPVIADFGLALDPEQERLTASQQLLGTPAAMAPEQALGRRDVGPPADLWALGVIAYELLGGRLPFEGEGFAATVAQILAGTPAPLRALRPELPAALDELLARLFAQDPAARPSAAEAAEAFAALARGEAPALPARTLAAAPHEGRRLTLALGAAALAAAAWLASQGGPRPREGASPQGAAPLADSDAPGGGSVAAERQARAAAEREAHAAAEREARAAAERDAQARAIAAEGSPAPARARRLDALAASAPLAGTAPLPAECAPVYLAAGRAHEFAGEAARARACLERAQRCDPGLELDEALVVPLGRRLREALLARDHEAAAGWLLILTRAGRAAPNALEPQELGALRASGALTGEDPPAAYWRGQAELAAGDPASLARAEALLASAAAGLRDPTLRAQARLGRLSARLARGGAPEEVEALWREPGFPERWRAAQLGARHTRGAARLEWLRRETEALRARTAETRGRTLPAGATGVSARVLARCVRQLADALRAEGRAEELEALRRDPELGPLLEGS